MIAMDTSYAITPFITWLIAGGLKFIINSIRARKLAFGLIGYGGLPSNHSAIVSSMVALIGLKEGISHPSFGIALTLAFIVILDASSLRRQIGKHASAINRIAVDASFHILLRERMGHTHMEIAAGILVGTVVALAVNRVFA
jgi:acid phosphatase family membrane protein YuiD